MPWFRLAATAVAQQSTILNDLELVLGVRAILLSNVTSDRSCPPGFFYSDHRHAGRDEPCECAATQHTHARPTVNP